MQCVWRHRGDPSIRRFHTQRQSRSISGYPWPTGRTVSCFASTYHLPAERHPDDAGGLDTYGRNSNPTWRRLESAIATLEGATAALVFGSGMAAITSMLRVLAEPQSVVVVPADGYYQVRRYATEHLGGLGVTVIEADSSEIFDAAARADLVVAETPTNPGLDVVDLNRLAAVCHSRGATLVVDNTTATPLGQQPLSLGADLVVASAAKALGTQ